jgi:hypothetical protein
MQSGTYVRASSGELAVVLGGEQLPDGGWLPLSGRTDLGLVEARALLVERGLAEAAEARGYYWYIPPSDAQASTVFMAGDDAEEPAAQAS